MKPLRILLNRLPPPGLILADREVEVLEAYVCLLREWNRKVNLISRKDEENIWTAHILHALSPLFHLVMPDTLRVLDLGSGGGLPGVPIAIVRQGWQVTLLDSIRKKCAAVEEMLQGLGLPNVHVVTGRAEDKDVIRENGGKFDMVVARGVAPMADLVRWSRPFARPSREAVGVIGSPLRTTLPALVAYKGGDLALELQGMKAKEGADPGAIIPLVFGGADDGMLQEKKLVVVGLSGGKNAVGGARKDR